MKHCIRLFLMDLFTRDYLKCCVCFLGNIQRLPSIDFTGSFTTDTKRYFQMQTHILLNVIFKLLFPLSVFFTSVELETFVDFYYDNFILQTNTHYVRSTTQCLCLLCAEKLKSFTIVGNVYHLNYVH